MNDQTKSNAPSHGIDQGRRTFLKHSTVGLLAAMTVHTFLRLPLASAAVSEGSGRRILVAYYSRTGNTRDVAEYARATSGGDILEIKTVSPYPTEYKATTVQAKQELESGFKPPLSTTIPDMNNYDVVFVGSPCWWGTIATPVISFLSACDLAGKTIVPFMTHEGSGFGRTVQHIGSMQPNSKILEGLVVRGRLSGWSRGSVESWVRSLGMAA